MTTQSSPAKDLARNAFEQKALSYYHTKRHDALNLDLGHADGFYHHHFAVGDFDRDILTLPEAVRQEAINAEMHRMETRQVDAIIDVLTAVAPRRVLDAGSGRGGTAFLLHRAFGCQVDGVNFAAYQNDFARAQAARHGCADQVRFHDRSMVDTGFPDATFDCVITNETTMYVQDLREAFAEFARVLKPGGHYVLMTWCRNDAVAPCSAEAEAIDVHYHSYTHRRGEYLSALHETGLFPYQVDDLTREAIPYWELRSQSTLASGIESAYLEGYRADRVNYIRIASRRTLH